jgi:hypothetical protein
MNQIPDPTPPRTISLATKMVGHPALPAAMLESATMREIWRDLSRGTRRLFRNNVGTGWAGGDGHRKALRVTPQNLALARAAVRSGDVIIPNARPLHAGLQRGSADNVGWETIEITITDAMVGQTIRLAVFLSVESKRRHGGRLEPEQRTWMEQVRQAGGIAVVARSSEEARAAVEAERAALLRIATGAS